MCIRDAENRRFIRALHISPCPEFSGAAFPVAFSLLLPEALELFTGTAFRACLIRQTVVLVDNLCLDRRKRLQEAGI
jgi:hypothetical protein